jgi:hypothetical protein
MNVPVCPRHRVPMQQIAADVEARCPFCGCVSRGTASDTCPQCGRHLETGPMEPYWCCPFCGDSVRISASQVENDLTPLVGTGVAGSVLRTEAPWPLALGPP